MVSTRLGEVLNSRKDNMFLGLRVCFSFLSGIGLSGIVLDSFYRQIPLCSKSFLVIRSFCESFHKALSIYAR